MSVSVRGLREWHPLLSPRKETVRVVSGSENLPNLHRRVNRGFDTGPITEPFCTVVGVLDVFGLSRDLVRKGDVFFVSV